MEDCHFHFITNFIRKHYFDKRFLGPLSKAFMFRILNFLNLTWWSFWSTHWHIHRTHILGQLLNILTTFETIFTIYIFMWQLARLHRYTNFFLDSKIMIRWSSIPIKKHLLSCQQTIGTFYNEKIVGKNSLHSKSCIILNQYWIVYLISFKKNFKKSFNFFRWVQMVHILLWMQEQIKLWFT
jgi:hypothetical protein